MTGWQDKPPLSRREVRKNSRATDARLSGAEQPPPAVAAVDSAAPQSHDSGPGAALPEPERGTRAGTGGRRVQWDPATSAPLVPAVTLDSATAAESTRPVGRRSSFTAVTSASRAARGVAEATTDAGTGPTADAQRAQPALPVPVVQDELRDETGIGMPPPRISRRASFVAPSTAGQPPAEFVTAPAATPAPSGVEPVGAAPRPLTMTRRELRALRAAAAAAGEPIPDIMLTADGTVTLTSAIQVITAEQIRDAQEIRDAQQSPDAADDTDIAVIEIEIDPLPAEGVPAAASDEPGVQEADAENDADANHPTIAAADRGVEPAQDAVEVPFGHWSTQAALEDPADSGDSVLSRNVGVTTGAITTHALVLPSSAGPGDQLLGSLSSTGEIMITGSIDLPRSFGSTGAHPALFDHPEVDALIDADDREDAQSDSPPVRAVRAVSSGSSARGVIEPPAPRKSRVPLVAGITAGSLLLIAIGATVTAFAFNVF